MPMRPPIHKPFRSLPKTDGRDSACKRGYDNGRWQAIRQQILARDHYLCRSCGEPVGSSGEVDHIVARRNGGSDDYDNLQTLCKTCHSRKTRAGN